MALECIHQSKNSFLLLPLDSFLSDKGLETGTLSHGVSGCLQICAGTGQKTLILTFKMTFSPPILCIARFLPKIIVAFVQNNLKVSEKM